ncbi:hypothetical protein Dimus_011214 [Dionaea muscipula]
MGRRALATPNSSTKKSQLLKRKASLKKKLYELSTLCGVDSVMIIYDQESVFPDVTSHSNSGNDAQAILSRYKAAAAADAPTMGTRKRKRDLSLFDVFEQKKIRAEKQLAELHHGAVENNRPEEADSLRGLNKYQLMCFADHLDEKIAALRQRIELLKGASNLEILGPSDQGLLSMILADEYHPGPVGTMATVEDDYLWDDRMAAVIHDDQQEEFFLELDAIDRTLSEQLAENFLSPQRWETMMAVSLHQDSPWCPSLTTDAADYDHLFDSIF